jgi:hypothetical protein
VLTGDLLVVGTGNTSAGRGELLALEAATGVVRWRLPLGDAVWSSPVVAGNEIYIGCDDGGVVAIEQANATVPRLAVYHDSTATGRPYVAGGRLAFEYFRGIGYQALDADSLARFLADRIADGIPRTDDSGGLRVMSARAIGPGSWVIGFRSSVLPDRRLLQLRRHAIAGR